MEVTFIGTPSPGVWKHYKGGLCRLLLIADYVGAFDPGAVTEHEYEGFPENTKLAVYVALYDNPHGNRVLVRPVREWMERLNDVEWIETGGAKHIYTGPRYTWMGTP